MVMKIVIDTTPLRSAHKTRGVGQYTRYLIDALKRLKSDHRFVLTSKVDSILNVDLVHYPFFVILSFCSFVNFLATSS